MRFKYERAYIVLHEGISETIDDMYEYSNTLVKNDKDTKAVKKIYKKLLNSYCLANKLFTEDADYKEFDYKEAYFKLRSDINSVVKLLMYLSITVRSDKDKKYIIKELLKLRKIDTE